MQPCPAGSLPGIKALTARSGCGGGEKEMQKNCLFSLTFSDAEHTIMLTSLMEKSNQWRKIS
jgi:hypothetical protein